MDRDETVDYDVVKCKVKECVYNDHDDEICELEAIKIGPDGLGDTDCMSFESSKRKDYK